MKNFLNPGETMTYTAPAGGVVTGLAYLIGALFVVAEASANAGVLFAGVVEGHVSLPKPNEGNLVEGQALFWDAANLRVSIDATVGLPIGSVGTSGALAADTTTPVLLSGISLAGRTHTVRKRFTIAQINAGVTLLPALPGVAYRHLSSHAIAYGGLVGATTSVDLKATQAAAPVTLVSFLQASLTRSTKVLDGSAGGTIIADGGSYVKNDINTPITVIKNGADLTTATGVDVSMTYSVE